MSAFLFAGSVGSLAVAHDTFNTTLFLFVLCFGTFSRWKGAWRKRKSHDFLSLLGPDPTVVVIETGES